MGGDRPRVAWCPRCIGRVVPNPTTMEAGVTMRTLEPEVVDVAWEAARHLVPVPVDRHPKGVTRPGYRTGCALGGC